MLDALRLTSPSVGGPLDLYRVTADGAVHVGDDELGDIRATVTRWEDLEQRALDDLFG